MNHRFGAKITREMVIRMIADTLLLNAALVAAFAGNLLLQVVQNSSASGPELFTEYSQAYLRSFWFVTLISLAVFYLNGFYTRGRMYRGRYKLLIIAQAGSLSYLTIGFFAFLFPRAIVIPRTVLIFAWALTIAFLITARIWSMLWKNLVRQESQPDIVVPERRTGVKNVLVIGGAGYIGSALLPKLLERGYNVRLMDLLVFGTEPIADSLNHPNLEIVQADFLRIDKVVAAMQGMDAVVHLGAIVGDPACAIDTDLTTNVNLEATRMIAEVARGHGVQRFVFASTCSVYGAGDEVLDERSALNPVSLYARSKIASERVLMSMASENFAPTYLRFGTIYGLSGRTRFDLVVNLLTAKALFDKQITVFGGDQWRPFLHVDDAALSIFDVLEAPIDRVRNQVFNVGANSENYTIQKAAEVIHRLVPDAELLNLGEDTDLRNYRVNFDKIHRVVGYTPQWTVEKGVKQVMAAIEEGKVRDYRETRNSNLKSMQLYQKVHKAFVSDPARTGWHALGKGWTYRFLEEEEALPSMPVSAS